MDREGEGVPNATWQAMVHDDCYVIITQSQPLENPCYVMITVDRGSTSMIKVSRKSQYKDVYRITIEIPQRVLISRDNCCLFKGS